MCDAYNVYLQYIESFDTMFNGCIITDYAMLREEVLKNHERRISFDSKKGLYRTYLENNIMITSKTLEGLQDKIFCFYLENNKGLYSFPQVLIRAFVFNREHDFLSQSTIDRYLVDYRKFLRDSAVFNQDIRSITESDVYSFFVDLMSHKPTSKVVSNIKTVIRLAFNYARVQEGIECLYVNSIFQNMQFSRRSFAPKKTPVDRVFSFQYRDKLFSVLSDDNIIDLGIKLTFYTGLRVGELCSLRCSDVNFNNRTLHVSRSECVVGVGKNRRYFDSDPKGYKERDVILCDAALLILEKLVSDLDFLFPYHDFHYHKCSFDSRLRVLCKRCGLPGFSMHDIRRTYASMLLDNKEVTEKFVQEQLGHSDIRITQEYYHYTVSLHNDYIRMSNSIR